MREYIQRQVASLIKEHGTRDPEQLAVALDIGIKYANIGSLKGLYTEILGNRFIVINETLQDPERRIILAHELGHDRLHRHMIDSVLQETMLYDMTSQPEYEANLFASELLIDKTEADQLTKEGATIEQLAAHFGVSTQMVEIFLTGNNK